MELLIAVLQVVLLFVGVALALWWALRRLLTEQLLEQLQSLDFDFVIREYPAPANDLATDQIFVVSTALGDGTAAIGDVRVGAGRRGSHFHPVCQLSTEPPRLPRKPQREWRTRLG